MSDLNKRYEKRRLERIRRREHKKALRRRRNLAMCLVASVVLLLSGRFVMSKMTNNSNAMSARIIEDESSQEILTEEETFVSESDSISIDYMTREEVESLELAPRTEKVQAQAFQEKLDTFLITNKDATLYLRSSSKSNTVAVLPVGTYVETYGTDGEWTKVTSVGREGFIRNKDLDVISDPTLFKTVDGHVIVNATYGLDLDYHAVPNDEAQAALRVMLEAMSRDGLQLEVASTYRDAAEEAKELVLMGNPEGAPEPGHAVYQTGYGVQFYIAGTDPRMDNQFELTDQYNWLNEHANEYGFILRYPEGSESWTGYRSDSTIFYYVGIEDATIIHNEGLTMEQFYEINEELNQ